MEVFSAQLSTKANNAKSGVGIKLSPRGTKIPCLLFADDCLVFCKSSQ